MIHYLRPRRSWCLNVVKASLRICDIHWKLYCSCLHQWAIDCHWNCASDWHGGHGGTRPPSLLTRLLFLPRGQSNFRAIHYYNIQSRGFETSRDLAVRRLTAWRIKDLNHCWLVLYWTLRNKLQSNTLIFVQETTLKFFKRFSSVKGIWSTYPDTSQSFYPILPFCANLFTPISSIRPDALLINLVMVAPIGRFGQIVRSRFNLVSTELSYCCMKQG